MIVECLAIECNDSLSFAFADHLSKPRIELLDACSDCFLMLKHLMFVIFELVCDLVFVRVNNATHFK